MAKKDYYAILGVSKTATQDEIKSAYRQKAKQYHPDLHPDDKTCAEKFKECNEAYEILGNEENRRKYDSGEMDFEGFKFSEGMPHGFEDIFDSLFGNFMGGMGRGGQRAATDVGSDKRRVKGSHLYPSGKMPRLQRYGRGDFRRRKNLRQVRR